jgi:hypothetical protein
VIDVLDGFESRLDEGVPEVRGHHVFDDSIDASRGRGYSGRPPRFNCRASNAMSARFAIDEAVRFVSPIVSMKPCCYCADSQSFGVSSPHLAAIFP